MKIRLENRVFYLFILSAILMLALSVAADPGISSRYVLDILLLLLPFLKYKEQKKASLSAALFVLVPVSCYVEVLAGLYPGKLSCGLPSKWVPFLALCVLLQFCTYALVRQLLHFRNMKEVLGSGTIWNSVLLRSDLLYGSGFAFLLLLLVLCYLSGNSTFAFHGGLAVALLIAVLEVLTVIRWVRSRLFVVFPRLEERILESMKSVTTELNGKQYEQLYSEVYDRIVNYFEASSAYLEPTLSITDVARKCFTNKVYVSRAIHRATGKNFCQFVNYHRIRYAVAIFRKEPEMRVADMAYRSGFHNIVTFNMAFHLFMESTPSEWCRQERARLRNKKK